MSKKEKPLFIILGAGGYPVKISAAGNKFLLMAKSLKEAKYDVKLFNKYNTVVDLNSSDGEAKCIPYEFLSGKKKLNSTFKKLKGFFSSNMRLVLRLRQLDKLYSRKYVMISYCSFFMVPYYKILSMIFNFKLIVSIMEFHPSMKKGVFNKVNAYLFDYYAFKIADAALPISHFLEKFIRERNNNIPIFRLPAIADFDSVKILSSDYNDGAKYFLYCGNIGYREVIDKLIAAFLQINYPEIKLRLVLSGKDSLVEKFAEDISKYDNIQIYRKLDFNQLLKFYSNALALLAPLRPNIQDEARFPQKIPEYLSSGSPLITNAVGEVKYHLTDKKNVFFADSFSTDAYKSTMEYIIKHPALAKQVGLRGKENGKEFFDFRNFSTTFSKFLTSLY